MVLCGLAVITLVAQFWLSIWLYWTEVRPTEKAGSIGFSLRTYFLVTLHICAESLTRINANMIASKVAFVVRTWTDGFPPYYSEGAF